jgi:ribosome biogenesis GTPase
MKTHYQNNEYIDNRSKQTPIRRSKDNNRILRRDDGNVPENAVCGEVVAVIGNNVVVETNINGQIREINCVPTGTIITNNSYSNLIATGDKVYCYYNPNSLSKIIKVAERSSKLSRVSPANRNKEQIIAANIDTLLIFVSTFEPMMNTRFIDRYLISASISNIKPILCVNKIELAKKTAIAEILAPYKKMGIKIHYISALHNIGIATLKNTILKRKSVISGPSGAGKSTFLNKILGYEAQNVSEISDRTQKGTHTTSFSKRYNLSENGWIIDTPGLREFGIWDVSQSELGVLFPDFLNYYLKCKFTSCTHTHEPDCAVIDAVNSGKIEEERYLSYISMLDTLEK